MTYQVEIAETRTLVKEVEATSPEDAKRYVRALYLAEEIVLTPDNTQGDYKISVL